MIRLALRLWAANRLLMKGWQICGHEYLGMDIVDNIESPLHGTIPVSRVLQNQLDHLLELEIVQTERLLLKNLQKAMRLSDRSSWIIIFLGIAIMLHAMERDTWRLLYWVHHQEEVSRFGSLLDVVMKKFRSTPGDTLLNRMRWWTKMFTLATCCWLISIMQREV